MLALYRKVSGPEHPDTLRAMNNLANSYFDTGRRNEALKLASQLRCTADARGLIFAKRGRPRK